MTGGDPTPTKLPRKVIRKRTKDATPRYSVKVMGPGWTYVGYRQKTDKALFHREYSTKDGSTVVVKGKKRTHKPFGPIEFGPSPSERGSTCKAPDTPA